MTKKSFLPIALIGGAVAAVIYYAKDKKEAAGKLSFKNPKFKKFDVGLTEIKIDVTIDAVNPSGYDVPFDRYYGTVSNAQSKVADFSFSGAGKNVVIKADSTTILPFQISIPTIGLSLKLINVFKSIATGQKLDSVFSVNSFVFVAGKEWPINFAYDVQTQKSVSGIGFLTHLILKKIKALRRKKRARRGIHGLGDEVATINELVDISGLVEQPDHVVEGIGSVEGIGLLEKMLLRRFIKNRKKKKAARRLMQQAAATAAATSPTALQPGVILTPEQLAARRAAWEQRRLLRAQRRAARYGQAYNPALVPGYNPALNPAYNPAYNQQQVPGQYASLYNPNPNTASTAQVWNPATNSYIPRPATQPFFGN